MKLHLKKVWIWILSEFAISTFKLKKILNNFNHKNKKFQKALFFFMFILIILSHNSLKYIRLYLFQTLIFFKMLSILIHLYLNLNHWKRVKNSFKLYNENENERIYDKNFWKQKNK